MKTKRIPQHSTFTEFTQDWNSLVNKWPSLGIISSFLCSGCFLSRRCSYKTFNGSMLISIGLGCMLKRSIDIYIFGNIRGNALKVVLIITCMEVCCEKYWWLYWVGTWMCWIMSTDDDIDHVKIFLIPLNSSLDLY